MATSTDEKSTAVTNLQIKFLAEYFSKRYSRYNIIDWFDLGKNVAK